MDSLISEIALRCNDSQYTDFQRSTYEKVFYRVSRELSRKYNINNRFYNFVNTIEDIEEPILLKITSFKTENKVVINGKPYNKSSELKENCYVLKYLNNQLYFNYYNKLSGDLIHIYYLADINIDDYDIEETKPIIPIQFEEELITLSLIEIAKLGIPKFGNSEKGQKYKDILSIYSKDKRELDVNLNTTENEWTVIKLWSPIWKYNL